MKLVLSIIICLLFTGCIQKQAMMTSRGYASINVGISIYEIKNKYGPPYAIHSKDSTSEVYEYIERITLGTQIVEQMRYYLIVSKGKVIKKYIKINTPPTFNAIYSDDLYPNY